MVTVTQLLHNAEHFRGEQFTGQVRVSGGEGGGEGGGGGKEVREGGEKGGEEGGGGRKGSGEGEEGGR